MRVITPIKEKMFSLGLSIGLLFAISSILHQSVKYSIRIVETFPRVDDSEWLLANALSFWVIAATNWPAQFRQSVMIRVQLQCWAVWLLLLACLFMTQSWPVAHLVGNVFVVLAFVLGLYSLVALFRPRDLI
jgi:hypothetical protein